MPRQRPAPPRPDQSRLEFGDGRLDALRANAIEYGRDTWVGVTEHAPGRADADSVTKAHLVDDEVDRLFLESQQTGRRAGHAFGHALHGVVELIGWYRPVGPADFVRLMAVEARRDLERELFGLARADVEREQDILDAAAERKARPSDLTVVGNDHDVGETAEDGPRAEAITMYLRDDRLRRVPETLEATPQLVEQFFPIGVGRPITHRTTGGGVGTGRECPALAANDDHADIGITHAGINRGNQLGDHLAVDRIELVGSVQYQSGNSSATIFAKDERNFGHRVTPTDRTCEKPTRRRRPAPRRWGWSDRRLTARRCASPHASTRRRPGRRHARRSRPPWRGPRRRRAPRTYGASRAGSSTDRRHRAGVDRYLPCAGSRSPTGSCRHSHRAPRLRLRSVRGSCCRPTRCAGSTRSVAGGLDRETRES